MAGRYNRWLRAKLAARIESNGGYYTRHGSYPLSWCVRFYGAIDDAAEAVTALVEQAHVLCEADLTLRFPDFEEWFAGCGSDARYRYACELLHDDLANDDGLRMWCPDTARRYGFDYTGRGADRPFDMALGGYGRGGKHVCIEAFEGVKLDNLTCRGLAAVVADHLNADTYDLQVSNEWCRMLMGIMDELDETLTDENAERCGRIYESDWLARELGLLE